MEVCSQNLLDPKTILLKVNGNKCNMNCEYCSELPKKFTEEQCEFDFNKIKSILSVLPKDVDIILHGGEPSLIGKDAVRKIIDLVKDLGFQYKPSIQTNGFLGNDWIDFFEKNKDLLRLSVSIDGNKVCNAYRKTRRNDTALAFERVNSFLHGIDERSIEFRCIATVNHLSWDKGSEIVCYFNEFNNLRFVRLNPCFDIDENGVKSWAITPLQYLQCLEEAFLCMLHTESYKKYKLDPLMDIANNLRRETTKYEFKCNKFSSIFPDGTVTSCDAMREVEQKVEIGVDMFSAFQQPEYVESCIEKCESCKELSLCKGGCPPLMHRYSQYQRELLDEYCRYRIEIRKFIMEAMAE